jgi:hypothetical protein
MGQSRNPAKKAATTRKTAAKKTGKKAPARRQKNDNLEALGVGVSGVGAFKQRLQGQLLPLPSGLVVRAIRVDLQTFILQGSVPNPLMEIVNEALQKGKKADIPSMVGLDDGEVDLEAINEMVEIVDAVVIESVKEPQVHPIPEDDDMDDNLLYVSEFDAEDKMFIFQWAVGGTDDVERFREEARADLDALVEGQGTEAKAK